MPQPNPGPCAKPVLARSTLEDRYIVLRGIDDEAGHGDGLIQQDEFVQACLLLLWHVPQVQLQMATNNFNEAVATKLDRNTCYWKEASMQVDRSARFWIVSGYALTIGWVFSLEMADPYGQPGSPGEPEMFSGMYPGTKSSSFVAVAPVVVAILLLFWGLQRWFILKQDRQRALASHQELERIQSNQKRMVSLKKTCSSPASLQEPINAPDNKLRRNGRTSGEQWSTQWEQCERPHTGEELGPASPNTPYGPALSNQQSISHTRSRVSRHRRKSGESRDTSSRDDPSAAQVDNVACNVAYAVRRSDRRQPEAPPPLQGHGPSSADQQPQPAQRSVYAHQVLSLRHQLAILERQMELIELNDADYAEHSYDVDDKWGRV